MGTPAARGGHPTRSRTHMETTAGVGLSMAVMLSLLTAGAVLRWAATLTTLDLDLGDEIETDLG